MFLNDACILLDLLKAFVILFTIPTHYSIANKHIISNFQDIDQCGLRPCQNNGTSSDGMNNRIQLSKPRPISI